jgi:predicted NBD/HSP70 family sugar kinase
MTEHVGIDTSLRVRGSNHEGMRQFNERIVLQAIRLHGALPKAELARLTQLSKQTVSIIVERLLDEGLLVKQERIRGGIGQPSVPVALNPDGAYSIGVQVGRRSLEVLVANFCGHIVQHKAFYYEYPEPDHVLQKIEQGLQQIGDEMGDRWPLVVGLGLAAPLGIHQWGHLMGPQAAPALARWQGFDLKASVAQLTPLPVVFARDTVAACTAELLMGHGQIMPSFLYVYLGTFVGGGLVVQGRLLMGDRGNAGAIGSLPIALAQGGKAAQLLEVASGWQLEQALKTSGQDPLQALKPAIMSPTFETWTRPWLDQASNALAMTATAATALLDLDGVVIDGSLDAQLLEALVAKTRQAFAHYEHAGIRQPVIVKGEIGVHARALGGALLPLHTQFFPDKDVFLKQDAV